MKVSFNKTKIICTIGPSSWDEGVLRKLILQGMDIARFNLSHSSPSKHLSRIKSLKRMASKLDVPLGIMADLPGIKLRIGRVPSFVVEEGEVLKFVYARSSSSREIPLPYKGFFGLVNRNDTLFLDDGKIQAKVLRKSGLNFWAKVKNSGEVSSRKSIHIRGKTPDIKSPTPKDLNYAQFFAPYVDFVSISYVRYPQDVEKIKKAVKKINPYCMCIAKIETTQAVKNLKDILRVCEGVMVARGDLGLQADIVRMGVLQKIIIREAKRFNLPVIVATQILDSLVREVFPLRSEVSDITNAVLDGADALLLSNETSVGKYPLRAVNILRNVCAYTERVCRWSWQPKEGYRGGVGEGLSYAINALAQFLKVDKIIVITDDIALLARLSGPHLKQDVVLVSPQRKILPLANIFYRVLPLYFRQVSLKSVKTFLAGKSLVNKGKIYPVLLSLGEKKFIGMV